MLGIVSPGYFVRDLAVLLMSGAIVLMLTAMGKSIKANLGFNYFIKAFNGLLIAFIMITAAQIIGVLLRTTILNSDPTFAAVRSFLLTWVRCSSSSPLSCSTSPLPAANT